MKKLVWTVVLVSLAGCEAAATDVSVASSSGTAPMATSNIWTTATPLERSRVAIESDR